MGSRLQQSQHIAGPGSLHDLEMQTLNSIIFALIDNLSTCNGNFPGFIFDGCKVSCAPGPGDDDEEEGGGNEAVEDQDQEDQHVVRLEMLVRQIRRTTM